MKLHPTVFILLFFCGTLLAADSPPASYFIANEGQWEAPFAFRYDGAGGSYYITSEGMTIDLRQYERKANQPDPEMMPWERRESRPEFVRGHVVKVKYLNANANPEIVGEERLPHYSNYFIGQDSCRWRSFVGHYKRVTAKDVWPGVDIEYRIEPEGIESVYHLAAGVDPGVIQVQYDGLDAPLRADNQGNLILQTSLGQIREKSPYACQVWQGKREEVVVAYQIISGNTIRLACSGYDRNIGMVIDPLLYSSYLGGTSLDGIECVDHDSQGNIVLCGETVSPDFPVSAGAYQTTYRYGTDIFVTKFRPQGDSLLFSTYIGGWDSERPTDLLVDNFDRVYVIGYVLGSNGWPLTIDAFDTVYAGPQEGFLCRLSDNGANLEFSSYLGGSYIDQPQSLDMDDLGSIYIVGTTYSVDYLITPDALYSIKTGFETMFISIFDPGISSIVYSSFFTGVGDIGGGTVNVIAPMHLWIAGTEFSGNSIPTTSNALIPQSSAGHNGYCALLDLAHREVEYASYFPGIIYVCQAVDSTRLFLGGWTTTPDYPTSEDAFDTNWTGECKGFAMILELPNIVVHSTLIGENNGSGVTEIYSASISNLGRVIVTGRTAATDFPSTYDAFDSTFNGLTDGFLTIFSEDLSDIYYSTLFGGDRYDPSLDLTCDYNNSYWVAGLTESWNFPTTPNAYQPVCPDNGWDNGYFMHFYLPDSTSAVSNNRVLIPQSLSLNVYPNPFNSATTLSYILPYTNKLDIQVFDLLGRSVYVQHLGRIEAGKGSIPLDLSAYPSGAYYLQMQSSNQRVNTKLIHIR